MSRKRWLVAVVIGSTLALGGLITAIRFYSGQRADFYGDSYTVGVGYGISQSSDRFSTVLCLFSTNLERSMKQLASFGLNIRYSRPTLDLSTQLADDRVHPNVDGHLSIARQIAAVMSAQP